MTGDTPAPYDYTQDAAALRSLACRRRPLPRRGTPHLRRLMVSFVVMGVMAMMAGLGTYATFTSQSAVSHQTASGTVIVNLGTTGGVANRLNVNATGVAPGDTIQRTVDVIGSGTLTLASTTLTTTASTSSVLDSNVTDGLQLVMDRCSVPWTEAGTAPAYTYTCSGTTTSVASTRPVIATNLVLNNISTTPSTDRLRIKLSLPTSAGNAFQGVSSTINFQFTEAQRAGTNR